MHSTEGKRAIPARHDAADLFDLASFAEEPDEAVLGLDGVGVDAVQSREDAAGHV